MFGIRSEEERAMTPGPSSCDGLHSSNLIQPDPVRACLQGAELPNLMDPMRGIVLVLMNKLEKDKQGLELGPDDGPYCETFAVNLFNRANRVDRAGQADASTAKTFYVASIFIDVGPTC